jgi:hypothetical protein
MCGFDGNQVRHSQVASRARAVLAIQNFIETPDKPRRIYSSLTLLLPASPNPSPPSCAAARPHRSREPDGVRGDVDLSVVDLSVSIISKTPLDSLGKRLNNRFTKTV